MLACTCMQVKLTPLTVKKLEHQGIKVQLLGQIELATERGHPHEFVSLGEGEGGTAKGHALHPMHARTYALSL
jgi:hypothetical protein